MAGDEELNVDTMSDDQLKDLVKTLATEVTNLKNTRATAPASTAAGTSTRPVQNVTGNVAFGASAKIVTPMLQEKMTFEDYKHNVRVWQSYVKRHMPVEDHGNALVNALPQHDPKMIQKTVVEKVGLDNLDKANAVDRILEEMAKILQSEPFSRLLEWMRKWETLQQGNLEYEAFTLKLRSLVRSAAADFKFQIPTEM